jgi:hypothetical protein
MNPLAPVTSTRFFDSLMTDVLLRAGAARVRGVGARAHHGSGAAFRRCLVQQSCRRASAAERRKIAGKSAVGGVAGRKATCRAESADMSGGILLYSSASTTAHQPGPRLAFS